MTINKTSDRAFSMAVVTMLMLCSFATVFMATEDSEASPYSDLVNSGDDVNQVYTLNISTGQQFLYSGIGTNLDGYGTVAYTWEGTAKTASSGGDGIFWDASSKTLTGAFSTGAGTTKTGTLTATWTSPDNTGVTQTATQKINFVISQAINLDASATGYAQVGSDSDDTTMTITFTGGTNMSMTGGTASGVPFTAALSGNTITVKPNTTLTDEHINTTGYTLDLTVTNNDSKDSASIEVTIFVYDDILVSTNTAHLYTYEGATTGIVVSGFDVSINYETDSDSNTTVTDKTVTFNPTTGNVISGDLTQDNHFDVDVTTGFEDAGDLTGGANFKDYTATIHAEGSIPSSTGGTGPTTSEHDLTVTVTVYKSLQFMSKPKTTDITTTGVGGVGSNTMILSAYIDGALDVTFDWGDGSTTSPRDNDGYYSTVHTYRNDGTYLITITATNDMGTTTSKVIYNAEDESGVMPPVDDGDDGQNDDETPAPAPGDDDQQGGSKPAEESFIDEHGWMFIVFAVLAGLCVVAYFAFRIQHPVVIIAAIVMAVLAVLLFVYVDFGGIVDAINGGN